LEELFGSSTTAKCLLYLSAMSQGYSLEIARAFKISNTQVLRTLSKLERGDVLVGRNIGRARIYSLNKGWYLSKELSALLNAAVESMSMVEQEKHFMKRAKPRKKEKRS
jgi:predicted ArsR family transcriptional regulator